MRLNERISGIIKVTKVSQIKLAEVLGVSDSAVNQKLKSKKDLDSIKFVKAVARLSGMSICDILSEDDTLTVVQDSKSPYIVRKSSSIELEKSRLEHKVRLLENELSDTRRELIIALKQKDALKSELDEIKKILPIGTTAKLKK